MMAGIMQMSVDSEVWRRRLRSAMRFRRDAGGMAAIEFAMILPLLVLMFFGMIDISMGVGTDRKVTMVTQTMADLTSRYASVTETDFTNFFAIADAMITPYDKVPLKTTISQIYIDPAAKTGKVQWSRGEATLTAGSPIGVPADLIVKDASGAVSSNQYLILSQTSYLYQPIIGWVVPKAGITLTESTYTRPRQSTCIPISPGTTCTTKLTP